MIDYSKESEYFVGSFGWAICSLLWIALAVFDFVGSTDWVLFIWSCIWIAISIFYFIKSFILFREEKNRNNKRWQAIIDSYLKLH